MSNPKLLFIGPLNVGSTSLDRLEVLTDLSIDIIPFDTSKIEGQFSKIERSLAYRQNVGRIPKEINAALLSQAGNLHFDAVWVEKGVWIYPETLAEIRRRATRRVAIHYTPDAQFLQHRSRHVMRAISTYDLMVTTKPFEMDLYRHHGARDVVLVLQGYGRQFYPRAPSAEKLAKYGADVSFIGHCQKHYAERLKAAAKTGSDLRIWGPRWPRYARMARWAQPFIRGDAIWGEEYPIALSSTKIALGFLSKYIPETTTTRTFEIPATGVFMLAERTGDHTALFEEGREAEFFGGDDELRDKIRFYLANDDARARIAAAGRERCLRSNYSSEYQIKAVLDHLAKSGLQIAA